MLGNVTTAINSIDDILNDDEFYLESGLIDCLIELEKNEIGACLGRTVLFDINKNLNNSIFSSCSDWKGSFKFNQSFQMAQDSEIIEPK